MLLTDNQTPPTVQSGGVSCAVVNPGRLLSDRQSGTVQHQALR